MSGFIDIPDPTRRGKRRLLGRFNPSEQVIELPGEGGLVRVNLGELAAQAAGQGGVQREAGLEADGMEKSTQVGTKAA